MDWNMMIWLGAALVALGTGIAFVRASQRRSRQVPVPVRIQRDQSRLRR